MESRHKTIVHSILAKYPYQFYAYGSRVKGKISRISDLDLCYQEEIPPLIISELREEFKESNLPFEVDLVTWKNMKPWFRESIQVDLVLLNN